MAENLELGVFVQDCCRGLDPLGVGYAKLFHAKGLESGMLGSAAVALFECGLDVYFYDSERKRFFLINLEDVGHVIDLGCSPVRLFARALMLRFEWDEDAQEASVLKTQAEKYGFSRFDEFHQEFYAEWLKSPTYPEFERWKIRKLESLDK